MANRKDRMQQDTSGRMTGHALAGTKPTLKTLAELTGLAVTTVSRALADAPQIALDTRKRVRRAAEAIGHMPDRAAHRRRTGSTNVITLVLAPHEENLQRKNVV